MVKSIEILMQIDEIRIYFSSKSNKTKQSIPDNDLFNEIGFL